MPTEPSTTATTATFSSSSSGVSTQHYYPISSRLKTREEVKKWQRRVREGVSQRVSKCSKWHKSFCVCVCNVKRQIDWEAPSMCVCGAGEQPVISEVAELTKLNSDGSVSSFIHSVVYSIVFRLSSSEEDVPVFVPVPGGNSAHKCPLVLMTSLDGKQVFFTCLLLLYCTKVITQLSVNEKRCTP